jgi:hypothetical protein
MGVIGKILIITGAVLLVVGIVFVLWPKLPFLGKLPGDLSFNIGRVRIYAPLVTFLVISLVVTVIVNIVLRFFK